MDKNYDINENDFLDNELEEDSSQRQKLIGIDSDQMLFLVTLIHSNESGYIICPTDKPLEKNIYIIVNCPYGKDIAKVNGEVLSLKEVPEKMIFQFVRTATDSDIAKVEANKEKEIVAKQNCNELIKKHKLDMKLICAHYLIDEAKILFYFTSDKRVDFRELVKDLVALFKVRIELKQIGVRDESRMIGGVAICGKNYCCHAITDHLSPVSIKMAKEQNLSLNSVKISGTCGRLLCCLAYENEFYKSERRHFPTIGTIVTTFDKKNMKVAEINFITRMVKLEGEEGIVLMAPLKFLKQNQLQKRWYLNYFDPEKEKEHRCKRHQTVSANLEMFENEERLYNAPTSQTKTDEVKQKQFQSHQNNSKFRYRNRYNKYSSK